MPTDVFLSYSDVAKPPEMHKAKWMANLKCTTNGHNKFWRVGALQGASNKLRVEWGAIGTLGQHQIKEYPSQAHAMFNAGKMAGEKTKKGYVDAN